jgi:nucleotide-binding universal stress UspA family protein
MAIRDILVHLDTTPRSKVRLELAARYRAYLIGLSVTNGSVPASNGQTGAAMMEEGFRDWLGQQHLNGEWRLEKGSVAGVLMRLGRYADLTILGQPDPQDGERGLSEKAFVDVLRGIGRPILAVPYAGTFAGIGERVLVLWNGSPESTRALSEALPLLYGAKAVQVLVGNSECQSDFDKSDAERGILCHLSRHGVAAKGGGFLIDKGIETGEALLSYAADFGADLMVVGVSVNTRLRELIFASGVRTIIRKMTVPVLFSC